VPVDELSGKVVIDTGNYYPQRDGQLAELDEGATTSPNCSRPTSRSRVW
jgi:hypothetical protein